MDILWLAYPAFLRGLAVTLSVWALAHLIGMPLGLLFGWLRFAVRGNFNHSLAARVAVPLVETPPLFIKAVPLLVLLVWCHYLVPSSTGIIIPPFWTAVFVFGMYVAVSVSEIMHGAIRNIPAGELEAARALGFESWQVGRYIAAPIALRTSLPALCFLAVEVLKLTTLASAIALEELMHVTDLIIAQRYVALPAYTALAVMFAALILPLQWAAEWIAKRKWIGRV